MDSVCSSESPRGFAFYVALSLLKKQYVYGQTESIEKKEKEKWV